MAPDFITRAISCNELGDRLTGLGKRSNLENILPLRVLVRKIRYLRKEDSLHLLALRVQYQLFEQNRNGEQEKEDLLAFKIKRR